MNEVIIEMRVRGSAWSVIGSLSDVEPPGSLSDEAEGGRQIYMFGWYEGAAGVWRSRAGFDVETPAVREITTSGFDRLADLTQGPHELTLTVRGQEHRVRFTLKTA